MAFVVLGSKRRVGVGPITELHSCFDYPARVQLLHVGVDVNLARSQVHASHPPDLMRADPRITCGCSGESYVFAQFRDRLSRTQNGHAVCRESNTTAVAGFDGRADVKVYASVGAHPEIIDAAYSTR